LTLFSRFFAFALSLLLTLQPCLSHPTITAGLSGGDIGLSAAVGGGLGAAIALDNVKNNYLTHENGIAFANELKACGGNASCEKAVGEKYDKISDLNNAELAIVLEKNGQNLTKADMAILKKAQAAGDFSELHDVIYSYLEGDKHSNASEIFYNTQSKGEYVTYNIGDETYTDMFSIAAFINLRDVYGESVVHGDGSGLGDLAGLAYDQFGSGVFMPNGAGLATIGISRLKGSTTGRFWLKDGKIVDQAANSNISSTTTPNPLPASTTVKPNNGTPPVAANSNIAGQSGSTGGRSIEFDGKFYSADGFKISETYYNKLWGRVPDKNGRYAYRPAPFLQARDILDSNPKIMPDPHGAPGYLRYESSTWEMIYNPKTGQIGHIEPLRK
jgi:hypothetical protein